MSSQTKSRKPRVEYGADEARLKLGELINRAGVGGERVVVTRHGLPVVAMVSMEDLNALESGEAA